MEVRMASVIYKILHDDFRKIIQDSTSMSEALIQCGLRPVGSNRFTLMRRAVIEGLDIKHLIDSSIQKRQFKRIPLSEILVLGSSYSSIHTLKKRIFEKGLLENKCAICGQDPEWQGKPLTLHLDHINGDSSDHRLENLRIICPHCDSQLPTYKGRNSYRKPSLEKICSCGKPKQKSSKECRLCSNKHRKRKTKIEWPSYDELLQMLSETSILQVAKKLGVSDNAIRKHMKKYK